MKFSRRQRLSENLLYFLVWTAIALVPVLNTQMLGGSGINTGNVLAAWQRSAPYLLVFILHNTLIAPKLLIREHRYIWYLIVDLLAITAVFSIVAGYEAWFNNGDTGLSVDQGKASFTDLALYWNILLAFFMTGLNAAIKLLYRSLSDEQQMEELKRKNLEAEMHYLKYQINPHFFMNTLNNIHALIDIDQEHAKQAVIDLSKMMRYVLYESGIQSISLRKEIQFVQNYIDLMRIRYSGSVDIRFDHPAHVPENVPIPPLLLIVFVENAFKHGVSYNNPSFIHISIAHEAGSTHFSVRNSRHSGQKTVRSGGIGLENVHKRLELIYGNDCSLRIDEGDPTVYTITLKIPDQPCLPVLP